MNGILIFFKAVKLLFLRFNEISELVEAEQRKKEDELRESTRYNLDLCFLHRQESNLSHHSPHNCDHCKTLAELSLTGDRKAEMRLEKVHASYVLTDLRRERVSLTKAQ